MDNLPNIFQNILLNIIFITFPMLLYLFYVACPHNLNQKENKLLFEIALINSLYLIISNDANITLRTSAIFINIPIMISYMKGHGRFGIMASIFVAGYYVGELHGNMIVVAIQYLLYFIFYVLKEQKKLNDFQFFGSFILINWVFILCFMFFSEPTVNLSVAKGFEIFFVLITFCIVSYCVLFLFKWCEKIINLHMTLKELEQEKQIRVSLFKITHEIKNPIAVCKGYLDMFDVNNEEHSKKYIPIIKEEIEHTLLLLQDFLEINKTNIEKELLDVNMLLEEVIRHVEPILNKNKITCNQEGDDEEIFIVGDYNRLRQVLVNVLKNSAEAFGDKIDRFITIRTVVKNKHVTIIIEDNGMGISKENMKKLKEPFFTTKSKGTGLGVYLSDEIIKGHDGSMIYTSKEGEGTRVKIELPMEE